MNYYRLFCYALAVVLLGSIVSATAATNSVAPSAVALRQITVTADTLKPSRCASITLTNIVKGSVLISGSANNDLILGSPIADTINGGSGNDCIIGGGGIDVLIGGPGYDVCISTSALATIDLSCEVHFP